MDQKKFTELPALSQTLIELDSPDDHSSVLELDELYRQLNDASVLQI